jgi:hypothetical protein
MPQQVAHEDSVRASLSAWEPTVWRRSCIRTSSICAAFVSLRHADSIPAFEIGGFGLGTDGTTHSERRLSVSRVLSTGRAGGFLATNCGPADFVSASLITRVVKSMCSQRAGSAFVK